MLQQDMNVTFKYSGDTLTLTKVANVVFSLELVGEVLEQLDFSLIELYQGTGRELLEVRDVLFDLSDTNFMAAFLAATDKKVVVDTVEYEVVNAGKVIKFPFFKNSSLGTSPVLRFKKKTLGISQPNFYISQISSNYRYVGTN